MGLMDQYFDPETLALAKQMGQPSEEDKIRARNAALGQMGFAMLANNRGLSPGNAMGNALGNGGMAFNQTYQNQMDDSRQQNMQQFQMAGALQKMQQEAAKRQRIMEFRNGLPEADRGIFDMAPDKYIENMPRFQKQQLVEVADPNEPLRTQKQWMRPGETSGVVAGNGPMPEILDPRVQQAKRSIAAAGKSDVNVSYGAPVAGIDSAGNPVFFQPNKAGGAPAIVQGVKPADHEKALTESQAKSSAYLGQMRSAEDRLSGIQKDQSSIGQQLDIRMAGSPLNAIASPQAQQIGQAQNQWSEAFLRFKTGAAATADEIKLNNSTFFPQIGDKAEVVEQKRMMRHQAANDMAIASGKGAEKVGSVYAGKHPMKGQVVDGYKFKGGDPSKPESWERQ